MGVMLRRVGGDRVAGLARLGALWIAGVLAILLLAGAQGPVKVYRVGYLGTGTTAPGADLRPLDAFKQELRDSGWVEGRNLIIDFRFAEGRYERLAGLADELVSRKVDVIAAGPTPAVVAARKATQTIPIVGMGMVEPITLGLVASLPKPGGNVTGVTYSVGNDIYGKQLQLLKQAVPQARRVALLMNPTNTSTLLAITDSVKSAAASLGLQIEVVYASAPDEFDAAFVSMAAQKVGALLVIGDSVFLANRARLIDMALKHRLPTVSTQAQWAEAGGLIAYGPNLPALWRLGAVYVDKILRGAEPRQLPIVQPTKFELIVNLKTAGALGLTMPQPLLLSADEVIR